MGICCRSTGCVRVPDGHSSFARSVQRDGSSRTLIQIRDSPHNSCPSTHVHNAEPVRPPARPLQSKLFSRVSRQHCALKYCRNADVWSALVVYTSANIRVSSCLQARSAGSICSRQPYRRQLSLAAPCCSSLTCSFCFYIKERGSV